MTGFVRRLALACALLSTLAAAGTGIASAATLARTAFPIATFDESLASRFVTIGDVTYFEASSPTEGTSLWRSDGTPDGTQLVKGVHPNYSCCPSDDDPSLVSVGEILFFQGHESATGYELWKSDGSTAGTQIVKDLVPGSESGGAGRLTRVGDKLFFLGTNAYLFTSDGTEAGTQLVPPGWFFFPFDLTEANGLLFFNWEWIPDQRFDLWRSDGTQAGTYRVGPRSDELTDVNGALFSTRYRSEGESVVHELWRTDGSAAAVIVKDIEPEVQLQNWFPGPSSLTNVNGTLLFVTSYSAYESAIWSSDGTSEGTQRVSRPFLWSQSPAFLTNVDGTLFFTAADGPHGRELWKSDGTELGTQLVQDIRPGAAGSDPTALADVGGKLLFTACDDVTGCEPWLTSPSHPAALQVADIAPGPDSSNPTDFTVVGNLVLFRVQRDVDQPAWELWGMPLSVLSLECSDGIDDDGDGLIDVDGGAAANGGIPLGPPDPGCFDASSISYETRQCQNGLDDDGDGQVDFDGGASANHGVPIGTQDPECTRSWRNTERPSLCGLGAELVLVLPLLAWRAPRGRADRSRASSMRVA